MKSAWKACHVNMVGFFIFISLGAFGQDQKIADSLAVIYEEGDQAGADKLELLRNLSFNEMNDPELGIRYAEELIALAIKEGDALYEYRGYLQKGNKNRLMGNLDRALEDLFKSAEVARRANYLPGEGAAYMTIGDAYSVMGNSENAVRYYIQSIQLLRNTDDSLGLASVLTNTGDEYFNQGKYDTALLYFEEAGNLFTEINYPVGTAYSLGNMGMVYAEQGKDLLAEKAMNEASQILEEQGDYYPISVYLTYISDIYLRKNDIESSLGFATRSLKLATQYGLKAQISEAHLKLAELYERAGNLDAAYTHYKDHVVYRDSVKNIEGIQQMANLRTDYEVAQKQLELDLQKKNQRIITIATAIALFLIGLLAFGLYRRYHFIKATNKIIEAEKSRSEALLLNILPEETARELKEKGEVRAQKFESVTVLFTDFEGFTKLAEHVAPEHLIRSIDYYFKAFDEITSRYGLEKIKTIGDSYMCAGGLPTANATHARDVILAAREIVQLVENKSGNESAGLEHFTIRVGVHTGPVIAGIVGSKKWQYDIWGDTVNIASRMESNSEPGRINLSETTYLKIKDEFPCEYRGNIEARNRGSLKMYFLVT